MLSRLAALAALAALTTLACGDDPAALVFGDDEPEPRDAAAVAEDAEVSADPRRWIAGDLHMHVSPPDSDGVELSIEELEVIGFDRGLEFMILTPHLHPPRWDAPAKRRAWLKGWRRLADAAAAADAVTMIPGVEYTTGLGHFGVSGVDLGALDGDFLAAADQARPGGPGSQPGVDHQVARGRALLVDLDRERVLPRSGDQRRDECRDVDRLVLVERRR